MAKPTQSPLSDLPADVDCLGFDPYARALAGMVADPRTESPLTIGIFGDWGTGKSSLMRQIERFVQKRPRATSKKFPIKCLWFNAWLYSREESLWRALILRVLDDARELIPEGSDAAKDAKQDLDRIATQLTAATQGAGGPALRLSGKQVNLSATEVSLPLLAGLRLLKANFGVLEGEAVDVDALIAAVEGEEARAQEKRIAALDDFRRTFERVSKAHIVNRGRLVVFVDDLDRCLPDKAVEVLEAVKLFLDVPGCIFILGVDHKIIAQGIKVRYRDFVNEQNEMLLDGARYLEKIIQIPFTLPPITPEAGREYVGKIARERMPNEDCVEVFSRGLERNPRRIKRTLNIFLLLHRLAMIHPGLKDRIKPVRLAKIVIIQQHHPGLFDLLIKEGRHYLSDLERRLREQATRPGETEDVRGRFTDLPADVAGGEEAGESAPVITAGRLQEFLGDTLLRDLLTWPDEGKPDCNFLGLSPDEIGEYIFLTRSTAREEEPAEEGRRTDLDPQMVTIPAGPFRMGTPPAQRDELLALHKAANKDFDPQWLDNELRVDDVKLESYAIGRYPVTNAEYGRFIEVGGYGERKYWTEEGWKAKDSESWSQPRYWDNATYNPPDQPVVGVSWHEAVAYCRWLSDVTGRNYRLPTEAEWEKAARGTDGRRYPWDGDWDAAHCNSKESGRGRPTPVGQYSPAGDSPFGCADMAGNVWEWCSTKWGGTGKKPNFGYPYPSPDKRDDREDIEGRDTRIVRGGSWLDDAPWCRGGCRGRNTPGDRNDSRGFRCARTLLPS